MSTEAPIANKSEKEKKDIIQSMAAYNRRRQWPRVEKIIYVNRTCPKKCELAVVEEITHEAFSIPESKVCAYCGLQLKPHLQFDRKPDASQIIIPGRK